MGAEQSVRFLSSSESLKEEKSNRRKKWDRLSVRRKSRKLKLERVLPNSMLTSPLVSNWIENLRYTAPGTLERFLVLKEFIRNIKASKDTDIYNILTDAGFVEKTLLDTIASSDNSLERDLAGIILSRITCHEFVGRVNCHKVGGVVTLLDGLQLDHEELCRRNYLIILANVVQFRPAAKECMHLSGSERLLEYMEEASVQKSRAHIALAATVLGNMANHEEVGSSLAETFTDMEKLRPFLAVFESKNVTYKRRVLVAVYSIGPHMNLSRDDVEHTELFQSLTKISTNFEENEFLRDLASQCIETIFLDAV